MAKQRHLTQAPVTEAVVDVRTALAQNFDVASLEKLPREIADKYCHSEALRTFSGSFGFDNELQTVKSETQDQGIVGYAFKTDDASRVVQLRKDGFTFSKLKPYETWEKLRDEAAYLWKIYAGIAKPEAVSRVALRFINHLNIPVLGENLDFDEYLTCAPRVPQELPQGIANFFCRVIIPNPSTGAVAVVHQAFESIDTKFVSVILDIDVYMQKDFDVEGGAFWDTLEQLRNFKNDIFFSYIHEKTAELFE